MLNKIRSLKFSSLKIIYNEMAKKEGFTVDP